MDHAPLILHIETATPLCSISLARGETTIATKEATEQNSHAKLLAPLIQELLTECNTNVKKLSAIAVSEGPGSYTGLRIGLSTAKGICYASGIPLILVNTLQAIAAGIQKQLGDNILYLPILDARRNDVYWSLHNAELSALKPYECSSVDVVMDYVKTNNIQVAIAGTGVSKFEPYKDSAQLYTNNVIQASNLSALALNKFMQQDFANLAYSEPLYRNN